MLNAHLDSWRDGKGSSKDLDYGPRLGTLGWMFDRYRHSAAFERVSRRSRPEYERALERLEILPTKDERLRVSAAAEDSVSARGR
jgi:hypothetical protein